MKRLFVMPLILFFLGPMYTLWALEDPYTVIIEKNLFNNERKAWILEKAKANQEKEVKKTKPKNDPANLELMGTIIVGDSRKAIIRTSKQKSDQQAAIYLPGDYVAGYLVKEIHEKSVVLNNNNLNEDITIFLREGKTQRSTTKTEIATASHEAAGQIAEKAAISSSKSKTESQPQKQIRRSQAETATELKNKFKNTLSLLKSKNNSFLREQAERDYKKLQTLVPFMPTGEKTEVLELKKEMDNLPAVTQ